MRIQPEWARQQAIWTAFPSHEDLWQEDLAPAQQEVAAMVRAIAQYQPVKLLVMGEVAMQAAQAQCGGDNVELIPAQFGDIWLRDTGPIFVSDNAGGLALKFRFNGWGGKYVLPHDDVVNDFIVRQRRIRSIPQDFVMEGGSLDFDGAGRLLTTKECLLNANRNPNLSQSEIEAKLTELFDLKQIIWLDHGLVNDHTDGHIDNIARFIAPNRVVCQSASGADDPNAETFAAIQQTLKLQGLEVVTVPSPGLVADEDGEAIAASHMNFIITNGVVVMPVYEENYSKQALADLTPLFPDREVIGLPAQHILTGGGSFHCITQQEPADV